MWKLNVYNDNDEIIKIVEAKELKMRMGMVRDIFEILALDKIDDTGELLKKLIACYDLVVKILSKLFPDMSDEDWDGVDPNEVLNLLIDVGKYAVQKTLTIPVNSEKK